jgi:hypothetical protein
VKSKFCLHSIAFSFAMFEFDKKSEYLFNTTEIKFGDSFKL